jgi:2-hydroxyacyl-CoA lyase 1
LLVLAGSNERHLTHKGAFQELDAISLLTPHVKFAVRPTGVDDFPLSIRNAYRAAWYGRPGPSFVDLPADHIQGSPSEDLEGLESLGVLPVPPAPAADAARLLRIAAILKSAKAPLVVIGKGAAYARAENVIRDFIHKTSIPFLPSPSGKGVVPDSHPLNTASARSTALKQADVVLLLGARLNWIFHYGEAPKWDPNARFIQVDISPEEIGRNGGDASLGIIGDVNIVVPQLQHQLEGWSYNVSTSAYIKALTLSRERNEAKAAETESQAKNPLSFTHAYKIIRETLHSLSPPENGGIVYVAEGANTMDISRSAFPVEYPRLRLDAGTHATMGVGMGYAIAAHEAYNSVSAEGKSGPPGRKKIIALEGDSAFGFSGMEIETMARSNMDILIFVMNNGGIYNGDAQSEEEFHAKREKGGKEGLRSWSLGWEVRYQMLAEACGGKGYFVRTDEELREATRQGFEAKVPVIVNVVIEPGKMGKVVRFFCPAFSDRRCELISVLTWFRSLHGKTTARQKRGRRMLQSFESIAGSVYHRAYVERQVYPRVPVFLLSFLLSLKNLPRRSRHQCTFRWLVLALEIISHFGKCHPLNTLVGVYVLNQPSLKVSECYLDSYTFTYRSCMSRTCGLPLTSGWMVIGKTNSSYSR